MINLALLSNTKCFSISTKNLTKHFGFIHLVKVLGNNLTRKSFHFISYNSELIIFLLQLLLRFFFDVSLNLLFFDKNVDIKIVKLKGLRIIKKNH